MNPPFPQSIHPCLCANTLTNTSDNSSEYLYAWNDVDVEYAVDSHLNLSTRRSRHQLRNLPQINAASQVHLPGVDLKNVQTSLFMQNENMVRMFFLKSIKMPIYAGEGVPLHLEGETQSSCQSCLVWVKQSPECRCGLWPLWPEQDKQSQLKWTRQECTVIVVLNVSDVGHSLHHKILFL